MAFRRNLRREMVTYLVLKPIIVTYALVMAGAFFWLRAKKLISLMNAVEGPKDLPRGDTARRVMILIRDVLFQTKVRHEKWPGIAHSLIFAGFLAIQPHSLSLMVKGVLPFIHLAEIHGPYLYCADIIAMFVLFGLGYGYYRRTVIKPAYLPESGDAMNILAFTTMVIVTFYLVNAFEMCLPDTPAFIRDNLPISGILAAAFNIAHMPPEKVLKGFEISYWLHIGTILCFLVYIPGSKHLHLLAAVPNVYLKPLATEKAIRKTDLEDEEKENFGLTSPLDLSRKNVLDLYACTECGRCEANCPAAITGKPLSPRKVVADIKHDLLDQADSVLSHDRERIKPLVREYGPGEEERLTNDALFSCTTCRACAEACPVYIDQPELIIEARKSRVLMEASFPPELMETFDNIENQYNPWGFSSEKRADWATDLDIPLACDNPEPEILYFVGCAGSFDDRGKKIAKSVVNVLKKAGVDFAILGNEEKCTGDAARRAGNEYIAQMLIMENVETLNQYKPKKILAPCPHCFNMLKNEYPAFGAKFDVAHHSTYFFDLLKQGRIRPNGASFGGALYHDSCYLGRWNGIYEAPRELLCSMNRGAKPVEAVRAKNKGFCCGAGGAGMFMEDASEKRINTERTDEILRVGKGNRVQTVASACPFCITMLTDGLKAENSDMEVLDLAEIVDKATD